MNRICRHGGRLRRPLFRADQREMAGDGCRERQRNGNGGARPARPGGAGRKSYPPALTIQPSLTSFGGARGYVDGAGAVPAANDPWVRRGDAGSTGGRFRSRRESRAMAISATEFLLLTDEELLTSPGVASCARCRCRLQETVTGYRDTEDGAMCSDCYYRTIGEFLDTHPIAVPRTRRGAH